MVLWLWQETGWTIILITHSIEKALRVGQRLIVMAPRPGRNNRDHALPFAEMGAGGDLRAVRKHPQFAARRDEILAMIRDMEEEIMGLAQ